MPSTDALTVDTLAPSQTLDVNTQETDGSAPEQDTAQTELILGKYKTMTDLEKGEAEREKLFGRQADELGKARSEIEALRQQVQMKDVLQAIANNTKPKEQSTSLDAESFASKLGEKWIEDPKAVAKELLGVSSHWVSESEKKTLSEVNMLKQELENKTKSLEELIEKLSPEYQEHKDAIDAMMSEGIPMATAKNLVKKLASASGSSGQFFSPTRIKPPASITPTRVSAPDTKPVANAEFMFDLRNDIEILRREWPNKTDQELAEIAKGMNERRSNRIASGEPVAMKTFKNVSRRI
jgi:hypothetical protein